MKWFSFVLLILVLTSGTQAQDPGAIQAKCQQELNDINNQLHQLNSEYEQIKKDLKAGLFCSLCKESKTTLDKKEGFYVHLKNVKGEAKQASAEQFTNEHRKYESRFNSLKDRYASKQKSCNENYNNAIAAQNRQREQERQSQIQKQQDLARQQQQQQQAQIQKQQDLARQQEQDRQNKIKAQQEAARQQQLAAQQFLEEQRQRQAALQQSILEQSENIKQQMVSQFQSDGDRMRNNIQQMKDRVNNMGSVSFDNSRPATSSGITRPSGNNTISADDFVTDEQPLDDWRTKSAEILRRSMRLFDTDNSQQEYEQNTCDDCFGSAGYTWKDVRTFVGNAIQKYVKRDYMQKVVATYPSLEPWYLRYRVGSAYAGFWQRNIESAQEINDAATDLLNKNFEMAMNGEYDEEQERQNERDFRERTAYSLPVAGSIAKGYNTLKKLYAEWWK